MLRAFRFWLINKLAGKDISVLLNTTLEDVAIFVDQDSLQAGIIKRCTFVQGKVKNSALNGAHSFKIKPIEE